MERHRCKLCWRRFGSGRALGGHMRSHVMNPSMYSDTQQQPDHFDTEEEEEEEEEEEVNEEGSLVSHQDRESESEASRRILTRRRSKRLRPASGLQSGLGRREKKLKCQVNRGSETWSELVEQGSSVSDSSVEDVAFCLMMLSRDKWNNTPEVEEEEEKHEEEEEEEVRAAAESEEEEEEDTEDDEDDSTKLQEKMGHQKKLALAKEKYKCETCLKTFSSYQALGGHRASHNKIKLVPNPSSLADPKIPDRRIHQCPVCHRVFPSGQALGGHKRSHAVMVPEVIQQERAPIRCGDVVIDLNFPAPADEDEVEAF